MIADELLPELSAGEPSAAWLESCFGPGTLWRPSPADLPAGIEHERTRAFLTGTGIPAVRLPSIDYDSSMLTDRGLWEADSAALFDEPADDDGPFLSYRVGEAGLLRLMVSGATGIVEVYDPEGWDRGDGYGGRAADSLPGFLVALGAFALYGRRYEDADPEAALAGLDELAGLFVRLGQDPGRLDFWETRLEDLREHLEDERDG